MKKTFFTLFITAIVTSNSFGQQWGTSGSPTVTDDRVWIGDGFNPANSLPPSVISGQTPAWLQIRDIEWPTNYTTGNTSLRIDRVLSGGSGIQHVAGKLIEASVDNSIEFSLSRDFKLAIGRANASDRLNVHNGNIGLTNDVDATERSIKAYTSAGNFRLYGNSTTANGSYIEMLGNTSAGYGKINFVHNNIAQSSFEFWKFNGGSSYTSQMIINNNGYVGIGDQNPTAQLTVNGEINFTTNPSAVRSIRGKTNSYLELYSNTNNSDGAGLFLHSTNSPYEKGAVIAMSNGTQNDDISFAITNFTVPSTYLNTFKTTKNGKVVVGNVPYTFATSGDYRLFVEKGIITEKVKVALKSTSNWSDFVFASDYELMPLSEVETFINEHKHLPSIPSAVEVVKDGLDVAEMDAKLLQKVEELTLYLIEQQKTIEMQQKQINKLINSKN